jgi:HD-GYP domain-containing protein (c-di-GMP phosphodiesterase class II)
VLVGTAFAVMASLLALHGFATPGIWVGMNGVVALTGGATLPVGAVILALSVVPLPRPLRGVRPLLALQAFLLVTVLSLGVTALVWPSLVPSVPAPNSAAAIGLLAVGLLAYGLLGLRALRTFLLTQRAIDLVVVVGIVWLGTALVPALTMGWDQLGWWMGHELELNGILLVGIAVALDLARAAQSRPLAGDLRGADLVASEDVFLGSHVRALTVRLAEKDPYTERHTRRVALRAVQVGEQLGLSASRLRTLAIGALVHDIGKLSVPDAILKKPGGLEDDEYEVIKRHPEWGCRLLNELGGFTAAVRQLVHDHHERLDGAGYPRGLSAGQIDLDTRILTVCDVYDALISKRVYRDAWSHEEAMALLHRETGSAFDGRCVAAIEQVVDPENAVAGRTEAAVALSTVS